MTVTFTPEERAESLVHAMHSNPDLRLRLLQFVAKASGISTAQALALIEGPLSKELGVQGVTVGHAIDHLPNISTPESKPMLDQPFTVLHQDRAALDRVLRSICLETEISYDAAHRRLYEADAEAGGRGTVGRVLELARLPVAAVGDSVKLLDRRDAEVGAVAAREMAALPDEPLDRQGRVLLTADIGTILHDPGEQERRLQRARRYDDRYAGPPGRTAFLDDDRFLAESGVDLCRTLERPGEEAAARGRVAETAKQLDQAIANSHEYRSRVRALDTELAEMKAKRDTVAARPMRGGAATQEAMILLEAPAKPEPPSKLELPTDRKELRKFQAAIKARLEKRTLDADWPREADEIDAAVWRQFCEAEVAKATQAELEAYHGVSSGAPQSTTSTAEAVAMDQLVRDELTRQGLPWGDYVKVLDQLLAEGVRPGAPESPQEPRGHNADLNQRVLDRLEAEHLPMTAYPRILEAVMREG